ncbi:hypothetical protein L1987_88162 [Smallanthus sonchifolius]|nr:hypothetical protein L1987_89895 [Smallanthus sonchifolius]KAI3664404.1 hypothetical protein L1987_89851 [Smallanthus sonchifolius]KAI3664435.1 hypothetical protein L1987_89816 [Smallanthus sonchifolius]KAI3664489.1 hypothetical protein L1987_89752 [Smallanthus sonchifolius]KAI3664539.1 hypothetical protein L1987_89702 [Smallanthus sonchifolius]
MGEKEKKEVFIEEALHPRTNADPEEWVWAFEKMNMQRVSPRGRVQEGLCRFLSTWCTSEGRTDSEKEEAWHEIGGGRISDSELLDSMDGGRALQLKHEINVESTIIQRGTTKRDRDQPLVNLVRSILREKKDGNEWEDWSSLFISRKELVSTSLIRRTNKKRLTV